MKLITAMLTTITLLASAVTEAQMLTITRGGSRSVSQAPAENFTGVARVEMLFETLDPFHASAGSVTFEPGARTAWHAHPAGQVLIARLAPAAFSAGVIPSRRSARETSSGSRPARSTGTARRRRRP
jgi:hypothetical protein